MSSREVIMECLDRAHGRLDLWIHFINAVRIKCMVEIGVYRGNFAAQLLSECKTITTYYMIDPWRHLDCWNKPANHSDTVLERYLSETITKTDFAKTKRVVLRGETNGVVDTIPDGSLDFAYIDGDHTLRGIAIDLIRIFPKIRVGGWIGGDDFGEPWQHPAAYEPTLVFPFAVHFAEALGAQIYALPYAQFLMEKRDDRSFAFVDLAGGYSDTSLRKHFNPYRVLALRSPRLVKLARMLGVHRS